MRYNTFLLIDHNTIQMHKVLVVLLSLFCLTANSQENPTQQARPIVEEGKRLYKSEMASWYGTDVFLENYKDRANIGGYFSYPENEKIKCVFFSKDDNPSVIGTISFDSTYNMRTAGIDMAERSFTNVEMDYYTIRKNAMAVIYSDSLFESYQNTSFNVIPIIHNGEKKVYVLTGTAQSGMVIFGNDYLLTFDQDNKLVLKKALHQSIIPVYYGDKQKVEDGEKIMGAMHTHLPETGDFITATDICTLMLYEKMAKWKSHVVVSEKYMNIWNCESDTLIVVPKQGEGQLNKELQKQNKKNKD
jgi:hypothetical protein